MNSRQQKTVAARYAHVFLKKGLMSVCRGRIMYMPSLDTFGADGIPDAEILGGATTIERVILAESLCLSNANVLYVKANGVAATVEFLQAAHNLTTRFQKRRAASFFSSAAFRIHIHSL